MSVTKTNWPVFSLGESTPIDVSSHLFNNVKWLETGELNDIHCLLRVRGVNGIDLLWRVYSSEALSTLFKV